MASSFPNGKGAVCKAYFVNPFAYTASDWQSLAECPVNIMRVLEEPVKFYSARFKRACMEAPMHSTNHLEKTVIVKFHDATSLAL